MSQIYNIITRACIGARVSDWDIDITSSDTAPYSHPSHQHRTPILEQISMIYCYYINSRSATAAFDVSDYKTEHYCALTLSAIDPRRVFIGGKLSFVLQWTSRKWWNIAPSALGRSRMYCWILWENLLINIHTVFDALIKLLSVDPSFPTSDKFLFYPVYAVTSIGLALYCLFLKAIGAKAPLNGGLQLAHACAHLQSRRPSLSTPLFMNTL